MFTSWKSVIFSATAKYMNDIIFGLVIFCKLICLILDAIGQEEPLEPLEKKLQKTMRCIKNLTCFKIKATQTPDASKEGGANNPHV